jgi:hypothetical protein
MSRVGSIWTFEDQRLLWSQFVNGMTAQNMAIAHGRTKLAIECKLALLEFNSYSYIGWEFPDAREYLLNKYNLFRINPTWHVSAILQDIFLVKINWTEDEDEQLRLKIDNGASLVDMARSHYRTIVSIRGRIKFLAIQEIDALQHLQSLDIISTILERYGLDIKQVENLLPYKCLYKLKVE